MSKTLGLDLGTNSIGWAVVDSGEKEIFGTGSRIFQEGVINMGDGEGREKSRNASRTDARGVRRQIYRRRMRKMLMLEKLIEYGLCPATPELLEQWKQKRKFPQTELAEWLKLNPYELRAKALTQKLSDHELGRLLYHLIQRRGFQSNSRKNGAEDGAIFKGKPADGKTGIDHTREQIQNSTLGETLNMLYPTPNKPYKKGVERIRNRYTTRDMYVDEFEKIWAVQEGLNLSLTSEMKTNLGGRKKDGYEKDGILFHQRPLRSQRHLLGKCTFEPTKQKCPKSAIEAENFRMHQWINTVDCDNEPLSEDEREKVVDLFYKKTKFKFKEVRKAIQKLDANYKFNYKLDDTIEGTHTISQLSSNKFFGKKWFEFTTKEQEDIWHVIYFFEDKDKLYEYAKANWGFDDEKAQTISSFQLKEGYANLSRKAIRGILPFLKQGLQYDIAVVMAGVYKAFGAKRWEALGEEEQHLLTTNIPEIARSNQKGGYLSALNDFLKENYGLVDKDLNKLYHHSVNQKKADVVERLPVNQEADKAIQAIKNPVVITALFELRRLVNELIDRFGKFDTIRIELARELKASRKERNKVRANQKRLEAENDRVKEELYQKNIRITHDTILKFKLWEECKKTCPYTGKTIGLTELFSNAVQIEHIHAWSRSLNDSFANKTLCFTAENAKKGNKTPFEFYGQYPEKWEEVKERALKLFSDTKAYPRSYLKFKHFVKQKHDDDFITRQLNDTRFISKASKDYLTQICEKIDVMNGGITAKLRYQWGLNSILNQEGESKSRDDNRHHALDALVIACTTRSHLQALSKNRSYNYNVSSDPIPEPWGNFREAVKTKIEEAIVSHRKSNPVLTVKKTTVEINGKLKQSTGIAARGQLHKETVFGKRQHPVTKQKAFHVRKPLSSITTKKQIDKIVDPAIRKLILNRIEELGGFQGKDKVPNNAFFKKDDKTNELIPMVHLPNKKGDAVPIKKVRMAENISGAEKLKDAIEQYVNPRNNHHVLIYEDESGVIDESIVTFWTAVERKKQKQPVYQLPVLAKHLPQPQKIITTLEINDMFLLYLDEESINWEDLKLLRKHLYRVQKLSSRYYEFRLATESTISHNEHPYMARIQSFGDGKTGWKNLNPIKVNVSSTGIITKL